MSLKEDLAKWIRGCKRLAILGVGNPLRGDDAIGVEIIKKLSDKVPEWIRLFNCEMVPENYLSEIEVYQPTHVLFIDAADFKAKPGEAKLILPEKIDEIAISTHIIPFSILAWIIRERIRSKIILLGVQPYQTEFNDTLSPALQKASEEIARVFIEAIRENK